MKSPGEEFHHRRFSGAAHGEVADADHHAAQAALFLEPTVVDSEPTAHCERVDLGKDAEHPAQGPRPDPAALPKDDLDGKLLQTFEGFLHDDSDRSLTADPALSGSSTRPRNPD